jgi:cytoskeleton-associated protein 5
LKARLNDSNKNLIVTALDAVAAIAKSMGAPFEKYARLLCSPVISCLSDNKTQIRMAALNALAHILSNSSFSTVAASAGVSLSNENPILRKDLLKWLADILPKQQDVDTSLLLPGALHCLQDRNPDVRKNAQVVLSHMIDLGGSDMIREKAQEIKGLNISQFFPNLDGKTSSTQSHSQSLPKSPVPRKSITQTPRKSASSTNVSRDSLQQPSSGAAPKGKVLRRFTSAPVLTSTENAENDNDFPIVSMDPKQKDLRADRDRGMTKWIFEPPRRELVEILRDQCQTNFSHSTFNQLFSEDHSKEKFHLMGLSRLDECLIDLSATSSTYGLDAEDIIRRYYSNLDLILKYITVRFFDTNMSIFLKCLELLEHLFGLLDDQGLYLSEYEASCFLPFFVNKVTVSCLFLHKILTRISPKRLETIRNPSD